MTHHQRKMQQEEETVYNYTTTKICHEIKWTHKIQHNHSHIFKKLNSHSLETKKSVF